MEEFWGRYCVRYTKEDVARDIQGDLVRKGTVAHKTVMDNIGFSDEGEWIRIPIKLADGIRDALLESFNNCVDLESLKPY
jgi:hypothetical protein